MAFLFVTLNGIEEIKDEKGDLKTLRVNCTELAPRNFNVNLIKQTAPVLQQVRSMIGKHVMLPIKEGKTSDGQAYFQLEQGQIIPVSPEYVKSLRNQEQPQPAKV